jgi:transposase
MFGCFTADLHALANWLERCGIKTVAVESTGVYWIALYEVLESRGFKVCVVNARSSQEPARTQDGCKGLSVGCNSCIPTGY